MSTVRPEEKGVNDGAARDETRRGTTRPEDMEERVHGRGRGHGAKVRRGEAEECKIAATRHSDSEEVTTGSCAESPREGTSAGAERSSAERSNGQHHLTS